jgi:hypothetical protein
MKVTIPEELKRDMPQTQWGKILSATPIVMTVIATLLAGLASSEMTRAQYDRAYAAQLQSKAGDQWGYFQAKKMRGAMQRNSLELLEATAGIHFIDSEDLKNLDPVAFRALFAGQMPAPPAATIDDAVHTALAAVENIKSEAEINATMANVKDAAIADALEAAKQNASDYEKAIKPIYQALDQLEPVATSFGQEKLRNFIASRFRIEAARYDAEATLNQNIGYLLELQVHKANLSAERHHNRSQKFFFGMLAAQAAIIVSTFAMAARQRNLLWTLAAVAGIAALIFAIYVYLRV